MTDDQKKRCGVIIHGSATAAGAAGALSLVPGPDAVIIMPIQVAMVAALAHACDAPLSKSLARSAAYAALGQILGKGSARLFGMWIPGLGQVVRAGVAFSVTQAIGWIIVDQLERGDFD